MKEGWKEGSRTSIDIEIGSYDIVNTQFKLSRSTSGAITTDRHMVEDCHATLIWTLDVASGLISRHWALQS